MMFNKIETEEELEGVLNEFTKFTRYRGGFSYEADIKPFIESLDKPVAGWYKDLSNEEWMGYFDGKEYLYGLNYVGKWIAMAGAGLESQERLLSHSEVYKALIKYAEKNYKGYYRYFMYDGEVLGQSPGSPAEILYDGQGNWAEIVEEEEIKIGDYVSFENSTNHIGKVTSIGHMDRYYYTGFNTIGIWKENDFYALISKPVRATPKQIHKWHERNIKREKPSQASKLFDEIQKNMYHIGVIRDQHEAIKDEIKITDDTTLKEYLRSIHSADINITLGQIVDYVTAQVKKNLGS